MAQEELVALEVLLFGLGTTIGDAVLSIEAFLGVGLAVSYIVVCVCEELNK